MAAKEKETRQTQPYKEREVQRAERNIAAYSRMHEMSLTLKWSKATQDTLASLVDGLTKLGKGLEQLPADFSPPSTPRGWTPSEGDEIVMREEILALYGRKKSPSLKIVGIQRTGDGAGSRVYIRSVSDDGSEIVGPQKHFRAK